MPDRRKYQKRKGQVVQAVRLDLDTDGFTYRKWGGVQRCKARDWIVDNNGDVYTVDHDTFTTTYRPVEGGYEKFGVVWAEQAEAAGSVPTKEGATAYTPGDYLVSNNEDGSDAWAVGKTKFEQMYEPVD
jgi:hypothetical protein